MNAPIKRQILAEWIKTKTPTRDPPQNKGHIQTESEGLEKYISLKWGPKESKSSNTYIRQNRLWNKDHEKRPRKNYIMIKGSIQEEDITIINIHAPSIGAPQYLGQILTSMNGKINTNTIVVGDFNTPLTPMDR